MNLFWTQKYEIGYSSLSLLLCLLLQYCGIILPNCGKQQKKNDIKSVQEAHFLLRSRRLRANANKLQLSSFKIRKAFFNNNETGIFRDRQQPQQPNLNQMMMSNPMMDPNNMVDMMKGNTMMIVPQLFIMAGVNYFFSGFVLVKLPFPLTVAFKGMLQRGVEVTTLDMSYVSSLSWYFLILFGLRGLTSIFLGETNLVDDAALMQQQMTMGMGAGGPQEIYKVYQSEKENLELVRHEWDVENVEARLLGKFVSKNSSVSSSTSSSNSASEQTPLLKKGGKR